MSSSSASIPAEMTVDPRVERNRRRLYALPILAVSVGLLAVAAYLTPSGTGVGTHEQLGLPSCGWVIFMEVPCPTCGMTTAFSHAARGDLIASFAAQPLGCVLAVSTAVALLISLLVMVTGAPLARPLGALWGRRTGWWIAAAVLAAWIYKLLSFRGYL
jgi:Na+/melibiose symporter-like transporter